MATGLLAALFVWLSVLAPALHQHTRTNFTPVVARTGRTERTGRGVSSAAVSSAGSRHDALSVDTIGINADDFCALCDYLTTATFAPPPPAPVCIFAETGAARAPPLAFALSVPLLRRALRGVSPRGPPARA